jgi:AcrR family transcriptional regulator
VRYPADVTAARHGRILQEASRLFRERGLNGVSVPEIMKAAKLTHGLFYNHFASREALVTEVIDRIIGNSCMRPRIRLRFPFNQRWLMAICVGLVQSERVVSAARGPQSRVEPWSLLGGSSRPLRRMSYAAKPRPEARQPAQIRGTVVDGWRAYNITAERSLLNLRSNHHGRHRALRHSRPG